MQQIFICFVDKFPNYPSYEELAERMKQMEQEKTESEQVVQAIENRASEQKEKRAAWIDGSLRLVTLMSEKSHLSGCIFSEL